MAKNTKTGRKSSNDPETPVCTEGLNPLNKKLRDLYVQFNKGTGSYSIKAGNCARRNVAWLRTGWLSLKFESVQGNPFHQYLIGEINQVLNENLRKWRCWEFELRPNNPTKFNEGSSYEGHLHFRDDAAALCFLSKFYRLHSCPDNPLDKTKEIEKPCK